MIIRGSLLLLVSCVTKIIVAQQGKVCVYSHRAGVGVGFRVVVPWPNNFVLKVYITNKIKLKAISDNLL